MLRRKLVVRYVIVAALALLGIGIYRSETSSSSGIIGSAFDAAKNVFDTNYDDEDPTWDNVIDVTPIISRLRNGSAYTFDWADWLDLDKTDMFYKEDLDPKLYPHLSSLSSKDTPKFPHEVNAPPAENAMLAKLYCKTSMPAPYRIVALHDPFVSNADGKNLLRDGVRTKSIEEFNVTSIPGKEHHQYGHKKPTKYHKVSDPLSEDLKAPNDKLNPSELMFPRIPTDLYTWTFDNEEQVTLNSDEQDHSHTIKLALTGIESSPKHFHEVWIKDDPMGYGSHYDWRFFSRILPHDEHRAALNAVGRTWQQFAEEAGILYWYAHGSLLGHYWSGLALPWDSDHDIQMPIIELDRLGRDFNATLVVQNPREGNHKYYIEVNPYYAHRYRGNGNNVIDARFIDIDTGVYIDITGLARNNPARKLVNCKNNHYYPVGQLERLRRSMFEGYPALVPATYEKMLKQEYKSYANPSFASWSYNSKLRLWEFKQSCEEFKAKHSSSNHVYCFPTDPIDEEDCMEKYGTCDRISLEQYELLANATLLHINETDAFNALKLTDNGPEAGTALDDLVNIMGTYMDPLLVSEHVEVELAKVD